MLVWGRFGVGLGSVWDRFWVDLGSVLDRRSFLKIDHQLLLKAKSGVPAEVRVRPVVGGDATFWKVLSLRCTSRANEMVESFRSTKRRRSSGGEDERRRKTLEELRAIIKECFDAGAKSRALERLQWLRENKDADLSLLQTQLAAWSQ